MRIDKDTLIYGSFAKEAGNNGCIMFNAAFDYYRLNAIYRSFSVDNIEEAIKSARTLKFSGFAITMPFKKEVLKYVDEFGDEVKKIGSANTIVNNEGVLKAYNTDYLAAKEILSEYENNRNLFIIGNGGYSAAVQYAAWELKRDYNIIHRFNWGRLSNIENSIIYNCTPVENIKVKDNNNFIDCIVSTKTGKKLSIIQASHQFKLYTGLDFPIKN